MPVAEADAVIATYIKDIKTAKVSGIVSRTYTGKTITQNPVVSLDGEKLVKGTDYDLKYSKNKSVGTATVKIEGKGKYKGSVTKTFKINPKGNSISKLYKGKRSFTVKWKRQFTKMSSSVTVRNIRKKRTGISPVLIFSARPVKARYAYPFDSLRIRISSLDARERYLFLGYAMYIFLRHISESAR